MSRPRVLVVRSGANPFASFGASEQIEIVETVSHAVEPIVPAGHDDFDVPDLAIFTSQVAVERVTTDPRLSTLRHAIESARRIAAVGPATADALRRRGIEPSLGAAGSAESLLASLPEHLPGSRVLWPCGEDAGSELPEGLERRGARVQRAVVYRKAARRRDPGLDAEIVAKPFAAFCTTSPSAARWLFEGLSESGVERLRHTPAVVLGPFTRRYLEARGVEGIAVAPDARFASALEMLEALATGTGAA